MPTPGKVCPRLARGPVLPGRGGGASVTQSQGVGLAVGASLVTPHRRARECRRAVVRARHGGEPGQLGGTSRSLDGPTVAVPFIGYRYRGRPAHRADSLAGTDREGAPHADEVVGTRSRRRGRGLNAPMVEGFDLGKAGLSPVLARLGPPPRTMSAAGRTRHRRRCPGTLGRPGPVPLATSAPAHRHARPT